jgi:glycosyltransferase involved in cell wall biosynthesis
MSATARQAMAERAIANVRDHFSTEVMAGKTLDVYDEVLAPSARS